MPKFDNDFYEEAQKSIIFNASLNNDEQKELIDELKTIIDEPNQSFWASLFKMKSPDEYNIVETRGQEDINDYSISWIKNFIEKRHGKPRTISLYSDKSVASIISDIENPKRGIIIQRYHILLFALLLELNIDQTRYLLINHCTEQDWNLKNPMDSLVFVALSKRKYKYEYWKLLWEVFSSFTTNNAWEAKYLGIVKLFFNQAKVDNTNYVLSFFETLFDEKSKSQNTEDVSNTFKLELENIDTNDLSTFEKFIAEKNKPREEKKTYITNEEEKLLCSYIKKELDLIAKYTYLNRNRVDVIQTTMHLRNIVFSYSINEYGNIKLEHPRGVDCWNFFYSGASVRARKEFELILSLSAEQNPISKFNFNKYVVLLSELLKNESEKGKLPSIYSFYDQNKDDKEYYDPEQRISLSTVIQHYENAPNTGNHRFECPYCNNRTLVFLSNRNLDEWKCENNECNKTGDILDFIIKHEQNNGITISRENAEERYNEIISINSSFSHYLFDKVAGKLFSDKEYQHKHQGTLFGEHLPTKPRLDRIYMNEFTVTREDLIYACLYRYQQLLEKPGSKIEFVELAFIKHVNRVLETAGFSRFDNSRKFEKYIIWSLKTSRPIDNIIIIDKLARQKR